jgi:hypothetical protein
VLVKLAHEAHEQIDIGARGYSKGRVHARLVGA